MPNKPSGGYAVVGCGSIGQRHIRNLRTLGVKEICAVDPRPDRLKNVQSRFGVRGFGTLSAALKAGPTAVLICSPTHLHLSQSLEAAKSGAALFIEKPISHSLAGVPRLLAVLKNKRLPCLVGCNFRFHPGLGKVKALLEAKALGRVVSVRAQFGSYLPDWRPKDDYRRVYSARRSMGGGILLDRIHEFDYLRWLLGDLREVSAWMGHLSALETDVEDTAEILVRFRSGAAGTVHLDAVRRPYDCRLEIIGDRGTVQWIYQDHTVRWWLASTGRWQEQKWPGYEGNRMYLDEMKHFFRVVRGQERPRQDAREAVEVLKAALAAKRASQRRRAVVLK